jgi:hypothetical protein
MKPMSASEKAFEPVEVEAEGRLTCSSDAVHGACARIRGGSITIAATIANTH